MTWGSGEYEGIAALIIAGGTALSGIISSRNTARHEQERVATGPIKVQPVTPAAFDASLTDRLDSDGVGQFMAILVKQYSGAIERLTKVEAEIENLKHTDAAFRSALGRWLSKVYVAWGHQPAMPMPDADDLVTLKDVLPH